MKMPWFTSVCRNSKSGLAFRWPRLSAEPVMKLSSASTRMPRASSASQRWDPMKPAPPETTARGLELLAANAAVREPEALHDGRIVDVPPVDDHRPPHQLLEARHVELAELVPFRDQDDMARLKQLMRRPVIV